MAIRPSLRMFIFLLTTHFIALAAVGVTELPLAIKSALILSVLVNLGYFLLRDVMLLLPTSWMSVALAPSGLSVVTRNGSNFTCYALGKTFVSPYCVLITVSMPGHIFRSSRVIFPDALAPGRYRELCVSLKHA